MDLDKLGWPYNRLKSPDDLGRFYRNAHKPLRPTDWRRLILFFLVHYALMHIGGYVPLWVWGAGELWRILGVFTVAIAGCAIGFWANRRGFFYATDQIPVEPNQLIGGTSGQGDVGGADGDGGEV